MRLGWIRQLPDIRDLVYTAPRPVLRVLPKRVDLRESCPPVYDQGGLGCHDENTEVLTERGWIRWPLYDGRTPLGTVHPTTGTLEFQSPMAVQAYDYNGPLYYSAHQRLDFALTPAHRMWVRRWNERNRKLESSFSFAPIEHIGWYSGLLASPTGFSGTEIESVRIGTRVYAGDDFLALVALVISDGWVGGTQHTENRIGFCCFRDAKRTAIEELGRRLGFNEQPNRRGVWLLSDATLSQWFRAQAYVGNIYRSPHKHVPSLVKVASQRQIEHFLQFFRDQHVGQNRQFYSSSPHMIDDLQELLLRIGHRGSICTDIPQDVRMSDGRWIKGSHCSTAYVLTEWNTPRLSLDKKEHIEVEHYKGSVYCASVPNSTLVTRRNGAVLISGNSCTANAVSAALEFNETKQGLDRLGCPSRLFIYYNARARIGTTAVDSGSVIRDAIKSVNHEGACPEPEWPYVIERFTEKPPVPVYESAKNYRAVQYLRVAQVSRQMRGCLAEGFPFVFGYVIYDSFMSEEVTRTGVGKLPQKDEAPTGGHACLCVGYDDTQKTYLCRNSWGEGWGQKGYFTLPMTYLERRSLSDDFWSLRSVT